MAEEHDHVYKLTPEFGDFKRQLGGLKGAMGGALSVAGGLSAAVLAAGAAFRSLANDVFSSVDEINTLSKASGLSAETVNGLRLAAKASSKELKDIVPKNLAKNMIAAARGSKDMADSFGSLGVSVTDSQGKLRDADSVFRETIDALNGMESSTEAAGVAAIVLGKQGRELLSAFDSSDGLNHFVDKAQQFGIQAGPDAIDASNAWWAATANLDLALEDAKQTIVGALAPAATKFTNDFSVGFVFLQQFTVSFFDLMETRLKTIGGAISKFMSGEFSALGELIKTGPADSMEVLSHAFDIAQAKSFGFIRTMGDGAEEVEDGIERDIIAATKYGLTVRDVAKEEAARIKAELDAEKERLKAWEDHMARVIEEGALREEQKEAQVKFVSEIDGIMRGFDDARRETIKEAWNEVKDQLIDGASLMGEAIQDAAVKSGESLLELRKQAVRNRKLADSDNKAEVKAADQKIADIDRQLEKKRNAAQMGFNLERGAALASIAQSAAVAYMALLPAFAFLLAGAPFAAGAVVLPAAAAQVAAVMSQKPPTFHDGGEVKPAPDEFAFGGNLARFGEKIMVANQRQAELMQQQNETGLMGGRSGSGSGGVMVLADAGRAMASAVLRDSQTPGSEVASVFGAVTGQTSIWGR